MIYRSLTLLVAILALLSFTALAGPVKVHDNQLIVKMKPGKGPSALAATGLKAVSHLRTMKLSYDTYEIVRAPGGEDPFEYARKLEATGLVEFAYPNVVKTVSTLQELEDGPAFWPDDTYLLNPFDRVDAAWENPRRCQWGLLWTNAPLAWNYTTGKSNVVVAVIDTGLKFGHPDLAGALWVNEDEIPGNSVDDDGNGFVDDVNGYDFTNYVVQSGTGGDPDPTDPQADSSAHGTWVAGVLGARTNNGRGIAGVAGGGRVGETGVRLMILRVGTNANITVDAEVAALDYAVSNGARIVSMSFGGPSGGAPEQNAVARAYSNGLLLVAAAGNVGAGNPDGVDLPAAFDEVIAVGATTIFDNTVVYPTTGLVAERVASYSKKGPELELTAPGTHILTTYGTNNYSSDPSTQFRGTSAATPMVSGFAALLASYFPAASNVELRTMMHESVVDLPPAGFDEDYGYGRIDMAKAFASSPPPPAPTIPGDADGNGSVGPEDVAVIEDKFGLRQGDAEYTAAADTNSDGVIDELDLFAVGLNWGKSVDDL